MRRLAFPTIVLMTLLLATVAAAPGVSAQAAAEHPAVGAWILDGRRTTRRTRWSWWPSAPAASSPTPARRGGLRIVGRHRRPNRGRDLPGPAQ